MRGVDNQLRHTDDLHKSSSYIFHIASHSDEVIEGWNVPCAAVGWALQLWDSRIKVDVEKLDAKCFIEMGGRDDNNMPQILSCGRDQENSLWICNDLFYLFMEILRVFPLERLNFKNTIKDKNEWLFKILEWCFQCGAVSIVRHGLIQTT